MNTTVEKMSINGVEYVRADAVKATPSLSGKRAVIVVDRGWIVAGDITRENGRIKVSNAVHVLGWDSIGFAGMIADPKSSKVRLAPLPNGFDIPEGAEIMCIPVPDGWGQK